MHDELLPRVEELLGLSAQSSLQQVINAQEAERQRRASMAARDKDKNLAWWNYPVPPEEELWLFVDTNTGPAGEARDAQRALAPRPRVG